MEVEHGRHDNFTDIHGISIRIHRSGSGHDGADRAHHISE